MLTGVVGHFEIQQTFGFKSARLRKKTKSYPTYS